MDGERRVGIWGGSMGEAGGPLQGRRTETAALGRLLQGARDGEARVLVLRGEPGVGKTALLDHLAWAATGSQVIRAAGVEAESEIAYATLQQLCAPLLDHLPELAAPQRAALETAFGMSAGEAPEALVIGVAVGSLLSRAAAEQPVTVIVDDVQWLDRMSEVILTFVARRLADGPIALVLAARSPGDEALLTGLPELRVEGLPDADARRLLEASLPGAVDPRVRDQIVAETRGNPLALLELPRGLSGAELAFGFDSQTTTPLASRLEEQFQRRIEALPDDARLLLLTAAAEPTGDVPLLWRAATRLGIGLDAGAPAQAAGLVELGARVRFRHPLVRSAARRSATPVELRAVHAALADATDVGQDPDRHAWHRAHAVPGFDDDVAAELETSAARALARGGRVAAAAFLERAVELTTNPADRARRALAAARARFASGGFAAASDLIAVAENGPLDVAAQAEAEGLRAKVALAQGDVGRVPASLLAAARRLESLDPAQARATYLTAFGSAFLAGRFAGDDLRGVAEAVRRVGPGAEPEGRLLQALATFALGAPGAAAPALQEALAEGATDPEAVWLAGAAAHEVWDDDALLVGSEQALDQARRSGRYSLLPTVLTFRASVLRHLGRLAEAADLVDEAESLVRASGGWPRRVGEAELAAYRDESPFEVLDEVAEQSAAGGLGWDLAVTQLSRAVALVARGQYGEAVVAAQDAAAHDEIGVSAMALPELVEAATRSGDHALAVAAAERLRARTGAVDTPWARGTQTLADALVATDDDAEALFQAAVEALGRTIMTVQHARARLLYGEWLRRANRRTDARAQLRGAHEVFAGIGATAFAARAARELGATGETVRTRVPGEREVLTDQEEQIAQLAVTGRTNPEIGSALFLSPRTVEWHLRKVYTKLDIASRRELGDALRRR